jgi:uncharacterized protein (TIGR02391 family)
MIRLTTEEAKELPVDELAMLILKDLKEGRETSEYNYGQLYVNDQYFGHDPVALGAVGEAMAWLRSQAMLARSMHETSGNFFYITRWGYEALELSLSQIHARQRVQADMHPLLLQRVRRQFMLGEYESGVFAAMKAVEVRVRKLGGYGDEDYGVDLMTKAFKTGGALADPDAQPGEVEGTMMLFRGAYAVLRNPSGHRDVAFDSINEATAAVMTADLLMRILDKAERRLRTATT